MNNVYIYVIILAWNHKEDSVECIGSFLDSDFKNLKLVVVDNGSTDGTSQFLKQTFNDSIEIIRSDVNLGIAGGYNLGIKYALENKANYLVVANNDIIVDKRMITEMFESITKIKGAGIIFPKIYNYYGNRKKLWTIGAKWRHLPPSVKMIGVGKIDKGDILEVKEIEFAPSCCLLVSSEVFEKIGFFDTDYFFYNDDWDFCIRTRRNGFRIFFVPNAKMWHKVSLSTQKSDKPDIWWYYLGKSTKLFYTKHYNSTYLYVFAFWFVVRELIKLHPKRIMPFLKGIIEKNTK